MSNQDIATRAFAIEALLTSLTDATRYAIAAGLDEHFISDCKHLASVAERNRPSETEAQGEAAK